EDVRDEIWDMVKPADPLRITLSDLLSCKPLQESEEEVTDTEQAENWFSLTSAQRICDVFLALDKDMNGTLSKQELREYADGTLTDIFIERGKNY
ncbi:probable serine/threonine-protein phosphatase 2A regulatory subunit B'' subunit TON2, partial [Tanacetum coccineum]